MLAKPFQRGFSLAEVLVSLAIIAILSAILIPALTGKVRESDGNRLVAGLVSVQNAVKLFAADLHRYPGKVVQLTDKISLNSKDVNSTVFPPKLEANWKGPYVVRDFFDYMGTVDLDASFKPVTGDNGIKYLTIQLNGVQPGEFSVIENALDAGTPSGTSSTAGVIRYSGTTLKFLAVPLL